MKHICLLGIGLGMAASLATNQASGAEPESRYGRFGISYSLGFNVSASFSNIGAFPALSNPNAPLVNPGDIRPYDDGFIGVDNAGNVAGQTSFWGFTNPAQVQGGNLVLSSASSLGGGSSVDNDTKLQHGVELTYNHQLGAFDWGAWGLEGALGWMPVNITDGRAASSSISIQMDTYPGNGIVFPVPPFTGDPAGPGPLIGDAPIGSTVVTVPGGLLTTGQRKIDASVFAFKLGPYLDYNLAKHVVLTLSGGLSLAVVDSEFTFTEVNTIAGVGTQAFSGRNRTADLLVGGYLSARVGWWLTENVSIFGGLTYQNVGSFTQQAGGRNAKLDLGSTVFLNAGVGFSF
jgi:hypothetical protein